MAERYLCSKLFMNILLVRVAIVLETLVGRVICGIKLVERNISSKWLKSRVFMYLGRFKLKSPVCIDLVCFLF